MFFATSISLALGVAPLAMGQTSKTGYVPLPIEVPSVVQRSMPMGPTNPSQVIHLSINLNPTNPAGLQAFADSVSDPLNPNYGNFITPKQVGSMFGQPASMIQKITSYLTSQGFKITLVADNHIGILADCTVGQAEKAFNTTINNYHALSAKEPGRLDYYSFSEQPQFPTTIAPAVLAIEGLQNFTKPHPKNVPLTPSQTRTLYSSASIYSGGSQGQGRKVAISSWDGFRLSNVPLYYKQFSLPTPSGGVGSNVTVVTVDGGSGAGTPNGEGDIDIQMVLGMAPLSTFIIYDGGGQLSDVLTKEANDNLADVISESYGWILDGGTAAACHNIHLTMTAQGITYMAAAGDSGTTLEPYAYPDYDPEVLIVGGTQANFDNKGNRISEPCWAGGGGGWATDSVPFNVLPSWQKGPGVPTNINQRLVPDVAFNANGNGTGAYQFFFNGVINYDYSGTSFASPMFAGLLTIAEQKIISIGGLTKAPHRLGRIQDLVYQQKGRSDVWFDVTQGANGMLPNGQYSQAAVGWDFTSGWGCMIMDGFVKATAVTPATVFAPTSASVFSNSFVSPAITEGTYVSGSAASLSKLDLNSFTVSPIMEVGIGKVASVQANFTTTLKPSTVASLNIGFSGTLPTAGAVMVYIYNWSTKSYDLLQTVPGTTAGNANTIAVTAKALANYVSSTGQVQTLARSLVPTSRLVGVGTYNFQLDQFVISATSNFSN